VGAVVAPHHTVELLARIIRFLLRARALGPSRTLLDPLDIITVELLF
jgi:hypothetical protein